MNMPEENTDEILEYYNRFKDMPAADILKYMGEMRDFFWKNMTPEGRKFFMETRLGVHDDGEEKEK